MAWYFRDNFFGAGVTEIENEQREPVGELDLRSAFGSSIEVRDEQGNLRCEGAFRFFSNKWTVTGPGGEEWGLLRHRFALFQKRFEYEAYGRGIYTIESPAFSREYEIYGEDGEPAASFEQVNGWFASGAFQLQCHGGQLDEYELVAVIMGVHQIRKREQNTAAT